MRAVQAYWNIGNRAACAFKNEFDLLVWRLSVIRNNKLGFHTVLYTTREDYDALSKVNLAQLYREVRYISKDEFRDINLTNFWSLPKLVAVREELKQPEPFFIQDTDLAFMSDDILEALKEPCLVWNDEEPMKRYPSLKEYPVPYGFRYPSWASVYARPVNTAILKCDDRAALKDWLDLAFSFMRGNPGEGNKGAMITAEQRFFAMSLRHHGITPVAYSPLRSGHPRSNFGPTHFHTWGYKNSIVAIKRTLKRSLRDLMAVLGQEDEGQRRWVEAHCGKDIEEAVQNPIEGPSPFSIYVKEQ